MWLFGYVDGLKRWGTAGWLNDEVTNVDPISKLDGNSFIFVSQFMGKLLQTGSHGADEPNYYYPKVNGWSKKIKNGFFSL